MKSTIGRPRALTQEQVNLILSWYDAMRAMKTLRQLAKELGVAPSTVYNVIRKRGEFKQPSRDCREAELSGRQAKRKDPR